jgi:hypothetical protein
MDMTIRDLLVNELTDDVDLGPRRLLHIAELLYAHAEQALEYATDPDARAYLRVQHWVALAHTHPGQAARNLAEALRAALDDHDGPGTIRIVRVCDALSTSLANQRGLLRYVVELGRHITSDTPSALGSPEDSEAGPVIHGVTLPSVERARLLVRPSGTSQIGRWNDWDGPVWTLRRLAGQINATTARLSLSSRSERRFDLSHEADLHTGIPLTALEQVDNLVVDLWRLEWGEPLEIVQANTETARRLQIGEADSAAAVYALLLAQLLHWHEADRLEVPSSWREGLLLPMRRVVLRLAREPNLTYPLDRLIRQHRQRFLSRPDKGDPRLRQSEQKSREESWRRVKFALLQGLQTVVERPDRRAGRVIWTLTNSEFSSATIETAQRIRQRLSAAAPAGRLEAELEQQDGIARPDRWLRCLLDVGLIQRRSDHWGLAGGEFDIA